MAYTKDTELTKSKKVSREFYKGKNCKNYSNYINIKDI